MQTAPGTRTMLLLADLRPRWRTATLLAAITLVSVLLRVVSALYQGDTVTDLPGIFDQFSYDALARQVAAHQGFRFAVDWWPATRADEPTAHWSYLYTVLLAAVYANLGPHPVIVRLLQAVAAGILYPTLAWRMGHRLFGPRVGVLSAALIAVYGYFIFYAGALMTETLYIAAVLWALDLLCQLGPRRVVRVRSWLLLGVALGAAVLLRQLLLVCLPLLFCWLIWVRGRSLPASWPHRLRSGARSVALGLTLTTLVVGALVLPWTIRNYIAFGRFVLLNTNAGYAFFWANHPVHGTHFISILPGSTYYDLIPRDLLSLDEAALDSALLARGIAFVQADPPRYARLSLSRIESYFEFWPASNSGAESNVARVLSAGVFLPLMFYGLVLAARRYRYTERSTQASLMLLVIFAGAYSVIHLLSWALIRYRLPVDAMLIPFAALACEDLWVRVTAH